MPPDPHEPLTRPPSWGARLRASVFSAAAYVGGMFVGLFVVKAGRAPHPATPREALWFVGKLALFFSAAVGFVVFIATRKRKPMR